MLSLTVELLHGWCRSSGAADGATMGQSEGAAEWPPSPARVFAALVAGGGTGAWRTVSGDDGELRRIESAPPPEIEADPPEDLCCSTLVDRFVVADSTATGYVQNYPGRTSSFTRPGERVSPRNPTVVYTWPTLTFDAGEQRAVVQRAARVGYLGASDAPVRVTPSFAEPVGAPDTGSGVSRATAGRLWKPAVRGSGGLPTDAFPALESPGAPTAAVSVPFDGLLEILDDRYRAFIDGASPPGATQHRVFHGYHIVGAYEPELAAPPRLWARFNRPLPAGRIVAVAEAVKGLLLNEFGPDAPAVLHGHGLGPNVDHARFVPLPFVGHQHANGRLMGVMVQFPVGVDRDVFLRCDAALRGGAIYLGDARRELMSVLNVELEPVPSTVRPATWERRATRWSTATPVVWDRYSGNRDVIEDVATMCERSGIARPISVAVERAPFVDGGLNLKPWQTSRGDGRPRPYAHVRLTFDRPVRGPILLGRMRSYGLGLFWPDDPRADKPRSDNARPNSSQLDSSEPSDSSGVSDRADADEVRTGSARRPRRSNTGQRLGGGRNG